MNVSGAKFMITRTTVSPAFSRKRPMIIISGSEFKLNIIFKMMLVLDVDTRRICDRKKSEDSTSKTGLVDMTGKQPLTIKAFSLLLHVVVTLVP
jgi:hypothetical protein